MDVLIGCEKSGAIRRALAARGHNVWSVDLLPSDDNSDHHIIGDVRDYLDSRWQMMIACPPCTRLCNSGVQWLEMPFCDCPEEATEAEQAIWWKLDVHARRVIMARLLAEGAALFSACLNAPIDRIAIENPTMHKYAKALIVGYFDPGRAVNPWQFGTDVNGPDNATKRTHFWRKNLPPLVPTGTLTGATADNRIHAAKPGKTRKQVRSDFFPGMALAIGDQWG